MKFVQSPRKNTCAAMRCKSRATHDGLCEKHDAEAKEAGVIPPWREGGGQASTALAMQKVATHASDMAELAQALEQQVGNLEKLAALRARIEAMPLATQVELDRAKLWLSKIHAQLTELTAWQQQLQKPLNVVLKQYRDTFGPYTKTLDEAKRLLQRRMAKALAAAAAQKQADLDAAFEGDTEALTRAVEAPTSPARKVRSWAFVEGKTYADLPMEYLAPDYDKLDRLAREAEQVGEALGGVIIVHEEFKVLPSKN